MNYPKEARQKLALQSQKWSCEICGLIKETIMKPKVKKEPSPEKIIKKDQEKEIKNELDVKQEVKQEVKQDDKSKTALPHKKSEKSSLYTTVKSTIIEEKDEYDDELKKQEEEILPIKKSTSVDPSNNIEFSETLRLLRIKQFTNSNSNNNTADLKDKEELVLKHHQSTTKLIPQKDNKEFDNYFKPQNHNIVNSFKNEPEQNKRTLSSLNKTKLIIKADNKTEEEKQVKPEIRQEIPIQEKICQTPPEKKIIHKVTENINIFNSHREELEFSECLFTLKEIKSTSEVKSEVLNQMLISNKSIEQQENKKQKLESKEKKRLELIAKGRQQAYKILLLNKYTEEKYRRITLCGLVLILVVGLIIFLNYTDYAKQYLLSLINQIPIDIEIN